MEILKEPDFWEALGLVIVIAIVLYRRVPAMLAKMLDDRAATIQSELNAAKQLREEAESVLVQYTRRASHAQAEAETILNDARQQAERFARESQTELKALVERRAKAAQDRIARAEADAVAEIRAMAADAAAAAAEKIIVARMDEKRSGAMIEQSLKDLSTKLN